MARLPREQYVILAIALMISTISALFIWRRFTGPSDGARLEPGPSVWRPDGVVVTRLSTPSGGLRSNDLVVSVEGHTILNLVEAVFRPRALHLRWEIGQTVQYQVLRDGRVQDVAVTLGRFPVGEVFRRQWGVILFALFTQFVATFVFLRRPHDRAAQLLFLWGWCASHTYVWAIGLQISDLVEPIGFWLYTAITPGAWLLFWCTALHFALIFPQRHAFTRKYPGIIPLSYILAYLIFSIYLILMYPVSGNLLVWLESWSRGNYLVAAIYLLLMIAVLVYGYRISRDPVVRTKVRWVVYAALISGGGGLVLWVLPPLIWNQRVIGVNTFGLLLLPFPISFAIAILRYQLFDIDVIIRRTIAYTALTALLVGIYFISVVALQFIFRSFITDTSQAAIVISTLAIAALFNPLRGRIQQGIDRRFYRHHYDAERTLASFSAKLRDEVDLDQITSHLLTVVEESMQPESVSIWLMQAEKLPRNTSYHE